MAFIAATPTEEDAVVVYDAACGESRVLRRAGDEPLDPAYVSVPRAIEFPTTGGRSAYAFFYPPSNPDFSGPVGALPPLVVQSHGGPTANTTPGLDPEIQFWTSRGIAVVDVNYGGSTGYGREYRERLRGEWGVVDPDDCIAAARHLVHRGEVDGRRLAIRGGSAGGYTTLRALVFHEVFAAGTSYYGVADLAILAKETRKFESRYLDGLIGPYPERSDLYRERSPIHLTDRLSCPLILFQGLEDEVVPPSQAKAMVKVLPAKGIPHAYLAFEWEQHGFRRAETIERCLEAELSFYGQVLGFMPADELEPVALA